MSAGGVGWAARLPERELHRRAGIATVSRGRDLARAGAVGPLEVRADGALAADVTGSVGAVYRTVVRPSAGDSWSADCSCPVGFDCKHGVAVLLAARQQRPPAGAPPGRPWEAALAGLLDPPDEDAPALGLLVVLDRDRVRLRPVRDNAGRWVRSGADWRSLAAAHGHTRSREAHRTALVRLHASWRLGRTSWFEGDDTWLPLADVGAHAFALLADVVAAGVVLLDGDAQPTVTLSAEPAAPVADLRQDDRGLVLHARLDAPGAGPGGVRPVGSGGVVVERPEGLLLAPLARPLGAPEQALLAASPLHVPAQDVPEFRRRYYPRLRRRVRVQSSDGSAAVPEVGPPRLRLRVAFLPGHVADLAWSFAYPVGDDVVVAPLAGAADVDRDAAAEEALLAALPVPPGPGRLTGVDTARFATDVLPALEGLVEVAVEGEPAPYAHTDAAPVVAVSATDRAGERDWFDLRVAVTVAGQDVPLGPLLAGLTTGEAHLVLDSGTWFDLDRPELEALRALLEEARALADPETGGLRVSAYQAGFWEELVALGVVAEQSARWTEAVGRLLEVPAPPPVPASLRADLRPYQRDGYAWLSTVWDLRLGGVLADDMGLGKTLQVLALAARLHEQGALAHPLLVVAPTSVVGAWAAEAARFCPDLPVAVLAETARRSGRPWAERVEGAAVVVTSYAVLRLDDEAFLAQAWAGLVLDEAQQVKNPRSKAYAVVRRLPAPVKVAVTGTPLENSLTDLWALLSVVAPGLFPDPEAFAETWRVPIESGQDPERLPALRRRVRPLLLRRTKQEVAADLPDKVEQVVDVALGPAHRRLYDQHLQRERQRVLGLLDDLPRNRFAVLRSLTLLRQLSLDAALVDARHDAVGSAKTDALVARLHEVAAEGHRALVFSSFTGYLARVRARLDAEGIGHCYLDGRTRDRARRVEQFRSGDAPAFLISLKAGGTGLTLTEADYVFVLDPWWNPAVEAQAVDRAHRIGQTRTVLVYRLVAADTVEQKVVALQERKRALFSAVVEGDGAGSGALTAEDLRALLS